MPDMNAIDNFKPIHKIFDRELDFIELGGLLTQFKNENPETVNLLNQLKIGFGIINDPRKDGGDKTYNKVNICINLT